MPDSVERMRLTQARLRAMTLARQFPAIRGRGPKQLLELFGRLGPIQSQVPRAPFLTAASRLPGIEYRTINGAFTDHGLLKGTNLRGTVHTAIVDQFGALDAARRPQQLRELGRVLQLGPQDVVALTRVVEEFCADDWRERAAIVDQVRGWLSAEHSSAPVHELERAMPQNLVWGHSGLVRRPRDDHWERRTDGYHRTAARVAAIKVIDTPGAITELVRIHLSSYGPASRQDVAWWLGCPLRAVDRALSVLDPELVHHTGPDGADLLDLASAPGPRTADPGVLLLPEFDGLLLGYAPPNRGRFVHPDHLDMIFARSNGQFAPTVLLDGRIAGTWRTIGGPSATVVEVRPFSHGSGITEDLLNAPLASVASALGLTITGLRLLPPTG